MYRGRGRGRGRGYRQRQPVYFAIDREGSVASDLSSLSDLSSESYRKVDISKQTAPIKVRTYTVDKATEFAHSMPPIL